MEFSARIDVRAPKLSLTTGASFDRDLNWDCHGCTSDAVPLGYHAIPSDISYLLGTSLASFSDGLKSISQEQVQAAKQDSSTKIPVRKEEYTTGRVTSPTGNN